MENSTLFVTPSGMFLEWDENPGCWVCECGSGHEVTKLSDPAITGQILKCNEYGFYPRLHIVGDMEIA